VWKGSISIIVLRKLFGSGSPKTGQRVPAGLFVASEIAGAVFVCNYSLKSWHTESLTPNVNSFEHLMKRLLLSDRDTDAHTNQIGNRRLRAFLLERYSLVYSSDALTKDYKHEIRSNTTLPALVLKCHRNA
jgi:hypothetical protein